MSRLYNKSYRSIFQADSTTVKSGSFRRKSASRVIIKQGITEKKGTILIVDISGYTHFVKEADHAAGAQVISSLLSSIITNNTLGFHISEIEGDAILFYKYGKAVVEAHRLLKNHIHSHTYALVTHQYLQQANHSNMEQWEDKSELCEVYDVGELCYTYFPYEIGAAS